APARRRTRRPVPRPFQALAAAALVAAGIAVGTVALGGGPAAAPNQVIVASATPPTTALLRVGPGRTELDVSSLAPAPKGRIYEVWIQRGGEPHPTDALFSPTSDGSATVAVPGSVRYGDVVMVTDEPTGGSTTPTRTPVIRAALQ
ncbi:MAG TPA: anti-sigma factor, partial [Solirubrobacteraceae bacterium]|nr:anti-sigma factor [Solirubrobacteraceae bacterium]